MGLTWGPPGADRTQVGPMLAPWILLSGYRQTTPSPIRFGARITRTNPWWLTRIFNMASDWLAAFASQSETIFEKNCWLTGILTWKFLSKPSICINCRWFSFQYHGLKHNHLLKCTFVLSLTSLLKPKYTRLWLMLKYPRRLNSN